MIRKAKWYFAYTEGVAQYVEKITGKSTNLTTLNNSIDTSELLQLRKTWESTPSDLIRAELNLHSEQTAIFIGAIDSSKRMDFIKASVQRVRNKFPDFELAICGSGPELHKVLGLEHQGIRYLGPADATLKVKLSRIGLCILNPGRVGLIAVDSFALGLPIITTDWEFHAPEYEYLVNGKNSITTRNSVEEFVKGVCEYLSTPSHIANLKEECLTNSYSFSIERMARNFNAGVENFLRSNPNA
jgi:glycosyltransferase involved in cell wall biosynthesis